MDVIRQLGNLRLHLLAPALAIHSVTPFGKLDDVALRWPSRQTVVRLASVMTGCMRHPGTPLKVIDR